MCTDEVQPALFMSDNEETIFVYVYASKLEIPKEMYGVSGRVYTGSSKVMKCGLQEAYDEY